MHYLVNWTSAATTYPAGAELTANDGVAGDQFGSAVALSGSTALVAANNKTVGSNSLQGVVYVLTFNGSSWVQQQELTASDGAAGDGFGSAVALLGSTALVAADGKDSFRGAVYVFTFNGSSWVQQQELTASNGVADDGFGASVALSGTTALVGASGVAINGDPDGGAAYVFQGSSGTWIQQQELTASNGVGGDYLGISVAISGSTALVGTCCVGTGSNAAEGAAYIFSFNGSTWIQKQELTAADATQSEFFGTSVALSGTTALVGAYGKTAGSNRYQGAAYVFTFSGSSWVQQQELTASDGAAGDSFGQSVALAGNTALVGASGKAVGSNFVQGVAYLFQDNGGAWIQQQELTASNSAADEEFGYSVSLSGTKGLVGAPYDPFVSTVGPGTAYVFSPADTIFCDGFNGTVVCK